MKKIFFTFLMGLGISSLALASSADIFQYDANQVNEEIAQLQALEDFVAVNPGVTLTSMQAENNALVTDLNMASGEFNGMGSMSGEPALGIPSFLWGCVLGWVGILVVHLVAEDPAETKKALMGCIVSAAVYVVGVIVYYVIVLAVYGLY